jgi:hypothetical protein
VVEDEATVRIVGALTLQTQSYTVLQKPYTPLSLARIVRKVLDKQSAMKENSLN